MVSEVGSDNRAVLSPSRLLLLVEDEPDARSVLTRRMQTVGWTCLPHPDAESALRDPQLRYVDAVVADLMLGEGRMTGVDLIRALHGQDIRAPVVIVTAFADKAHMKEALNAGAAYLLEKPFSTEALRDVLTRVTTIHVDLARMVNRALAKRRLTPKEDAVARLVLKGLSSAEIAAITSNSEKTIKQHLTQIYFKFGVEGRAEFFHRVFPT
jgi:two-component system, NarL family, response regulator LiaR